MQPQNQNAQMQEVNGVKVALTDASQNEPATMNIKNFNKEVIGRGAYGVVYKAIPKHDATKVYALKEISKALLKKEEKLFQIFRERDILAEFNNCEQFIGLDATFMDSENFYFLMEYANKGTL